MLLRLLLYKLGQYQPCVAGLPYMVSEILQHCTLSTLTIIVTTKSDGDCYCNMSVMDCR